MPIQLKSTAQRGLGDSSSPTITEPVGAAAGDLLLAFYCVSSTSATCNAPTGWNILYSGLMPGGSYRFVVAYIVRSASAPSYAFTHTGTALNQYTIVCYGGVNPEDPILVAASPNTALLANPANPVPPSVSNTVANSHAVVLSYTDGGPTDENGYIPPSGFTSWTLPSASGGVTLVASRHIPSTGTVTPGTVTNGPSGGYDMWATTILLRPSNTIDNIKSPLVATYQTSFTDAPSSKSVSITAAVGDLLLVFVGARSGTTTTLSAPSGGTGITWTGGGGAVSDAYLQIYRAVVGSSQTMTVTVTRTVGTTDPWGFIVMQFMTNGFVPRLGDGGYSGTGKNGIINEPATSIKQYDVVTIFTIDTANSDGSTRTYDTTLGDPIEILYVQGVNGNYGVYLAYYPAVQIVPLASGTLPIGLTSPSTMTVTRGTWITPGPPNNGTQRYVAPSIGWF